VTPARRWDTDTRGVGVGDAQRWRPTVDLLRELTERAGWIAEEPELHLQPHLDAAAAPILRIAGTSVEPSGELIVDLEWIGSTVADRRAIRTALFALVGAIAETVTVVLEPPASQGRELEVVTGVLPSDGGFATHGHTVRLRVAVGKGGDRPPR
jgi:hypothetical protein